ncbi:MAG: MCE family protein [Bacteroidetes bacterium]|nr:MCE family protein [Bacteroidota bacterium]
MKVSNETKVGALTVIALVFLILGFNFLKNNDLFSKRKLIYAIFPNLGSLSRSNDVKVNGYRIGSIYKLAKTDKDANQFVVAIDVAEEVNIPKDSKAIISSPLIGASFINIEKGKDSSYLKIGDTLQSKEDKNLMDDVKAEVTPTLQKVRGSLDTLNLLINNVNSVIDASAKQNLHEALANLNKSSQSIKSLLDAETGAIAKTINSANEFINNIKKNSENINATIANAKSLSDKLAKLELQPTIDSLQSTISLLKNSAAKITSKDGSLGALISDRTLYDQINRTIIKAQTLVDDLRVHPKRYVNLSIFGKKDKGDYLNLPVGDSAFLDNKH